ncbi:hypothetical protein [Gordonia rubripertincta]|uniref:hypothetical protein n=1 Tax=Gordonia rubripertincta TaxID=36822 RepID=UPI0015F7B94A|nr:hypothetical protein [Gordonia rubripertincta]QMU22064.1 hypothetical protein H3V45_06115 [Gordonia rubripertincta]
MRRLPDSTAPAIAEQAGRPRGVFSRIRVPSGAAVAAYPIPKTKSGRSGSRGESITASAQVLTQKKIDRKTRRVPAQRWQSEAWQLRRETPELRFMGDRQARACSQVRLFIGRRDKLDEETTPVEDGPAADLAAMLFGNEPMVEQALKRYGQHLIFNGESLLLFTEKEGRIDWAPHAASEITGDSPNFKLNDGITTSNIDPATQMLVRSWTPDPERSAMPDAPVVAVMPVARELIGLTKYVSAQVDSRLAGAGLLLLPQGIESLMTPEADRPDDYSFSDELTDYMVVPIRDRDSAASVVPFMAMVPPELVDKVKHITFDSPLDPHMHERRQEAIRRIALGMDSDPSVLLGMADSNHWSAWAVDENEVKLGVAPILSTACHALTQVVQPLLGQMGVTDPEDHVVWFDTAPLDMRPDRSKDAKDLHERGAVSGETVRRETGFTDRDKPNADEHRRFLAEKLVLANPNFAPALAELIDLGDVDWSKATPTADAAPPGGAPPDAAEAPDPVDQTRAIPETRDDSPPAAEGLEQ